MGVLMAIENSLKKYFTMGVIDAGQGLQSLHIAGKVVTDDISAAWVNVGETNIVRLVVTANTYVAFSNLDAPSATVTATTTPAVMLIPGEHYVVCTGKWIRTSAAPSRVELLAL